MKHTIYFSAAQNMSQLGDNSVDLVVTSPPYPMIEMWDDIMGNQNPEITFALHSNKPRKAFELMHQELDKVWSECWRVLKEGSFYVSTLVMQQELLMEISLYTITIQELFRLARNWDL